MKTYKIELLPFPFEIETKAVLKKTTSAGIENDLKVNRQTASKYLNELAEGGFLVKYKIGTSNFYINQALFNLFVND